MLVLSLGMATRVKAPHAWVAPDQQGREASEMTSEITRDDFIQGRRKIEVEDILDGAARPSLSPAGFSMRSKTQEEKL